MYDTLTQHTKSNLSFAIHWKTKSYERCHLCAPPILQLHRTQYCKSEIAIGYLVYETERISNEFMNSAPDVRLRFRFSLARRQRSGFFVTFGCNCLALSAFCTGVGNSFGWTLNCWCFVVCQPSKWNLRLTAAWNINSKLLHAVAFRTSVPIWINRVIGDFSKCNFISSSYFVDGNDIACRVNRAYCLYVAAPWSVNNDWEVFEQTAFTFIFTHTQDLNRILPFQSRNVHWKCMWGQTMCVHWPSIQNHIFHSIQLHLPWLIVCEISTWIRTMGNEHKAYALACSRSHSLIRTIVETIFYLSRHIHSIHCSFPCHCLLVFSIMYIFYNCFSPLPGMGMALFLRAIVCMGRREMHF